MYLMRIGEFGAEKPVARVDDQLYVDLSDVVPDIDEAFLGSGGLSRIAPVVADRIAKGQVTAFAGERIGAPFARPHQILCIGLNYSDHAAETGQAVPDEPILFTKSPNTLIGPNDDVRIPRGSTKPDWEVELGVVIGRRCSYLDSPDEARDAIAGFCVVNDVSERAFQMDHNGQWSKGKSAETFNPAGPWLVTPDELDDPDDLALGCAVNGETVQDGRTSDLIFDVPSLIAQLSEVLPLLPGDVVFTGTPSGVGQGRTPPRFLTPGDVLESWVEGIGRIRTTCVAPPARPPHRHLKP